MPEEAGPEKDMSKELGIPDIELKQVQKAIAEAERKSAGREGRPVPEMAGGAPGWLVQNQQELNQIRDQRLRQRIARYDNIPNSFLTPQRLEEMYFEILGQVNEGRIPENVATPFLGRITNKAEAYSQTQEGTRPAAGGARQQPQQESAEYLRRIADTLGAEAGRLGDEEIARVRENPRRWLRERLERLESFDWEFENAANGPLMREVVAALPAIRAVPEIGPQIEKEFLARYALHNLHVAIRAAPSTERMLEKAGLIDSEAMRTLFRLTPEGSNVPVVDRGFKEYERNGFEIVRANEQELENFESHINRELARQGGGQNGKQLEWARRIAEKLWVITGRSSYFDAFNTDSVKRRRGSGLFALKRIFNFREFIASPERPYGLPFWREGPGNRLVDLKIKDFWSEQSDEKIAVLLKLMPPEPEGLSEEQKKQRRNQAKQLIETRQLRDENEFLRSLGTWDFAGIDFVKELPRPLLVLYFDKANKADAARPLLSDPGGLFEQPTWEKFAALSKAFGHLRQDEKFAMLAQYLRGVIEFNRRTGIRRGSRSYSEGQLQWEPWDSTKIHTVVEHLYSGGYINRVLADRLEREYGATRARAEVSMAGEMAKAAGWQFIKSIFGLK